MQQQIITTLTIEELRSIIKETMSEFHSESVSPRTDLSSAETLMTTKELEDFLKVSSVTIWHWKKQGRIPYRKIGRRVYFERNEILEAMPQFKNTHTRSRRKDS